jgi:sugar (pentulose or hexulose) kinase
LESNLGVAGMALKWLADVLFAGQKADETRDGGPISLLLQAAEKAPPGSGGVMMLLGPRLYDGKYAGPRRGGFFAPSLSGMYELPDPAACLSRAFLENLACAARGNMEQIREVSVSPPRRLVFSGGMAQSELLAQIMAELTGLTVEVPREIETTSLGAAILAGVGAGYFPDIGQGMKAAVTMAKEFRPHEGQKAFYEKFFADWRGLHGHVARWEPATPIE